MDKATEHAIDVEITDVNGGNTERKSNVVDIRMSIVSETLKTEETPLQKEEKKIELENMTKMEEEVNGNVKIVTGKKSITPVARRKLRKFKANSTSNVDSPNDSKSNKTQKRKLSEPDADVSDDSMDFTGFETNSTTEPASTIIQKLIAEAEALDADSIKRLRRSSSKDPRRNIEFKTVDGPGILDNNDVKMRLDDTMDPSDMKKFKKNFDKSDIESDGDHLKIEGNTSGRSPNKSLMGTNKQKGVKTTGGVSPASAMKNSKTADATSSAFREPFKYGWKREIVYKGESENSIKRTIEVSYFTPKGKKIKNLREVADNLDTKELTIENFTFMKEPVGLNNAEFEIIKDEAIVNSSVAVTTSGKKIGSVGKRGGITRRMTGKSLPPQLMKTPAKVLQTVPNFKTKLPNKRIFQKKDVSPPKESDILMPWSNSEGITRRSHSNVENPVSPYKSKRALKRKLQEPCSIRCSMSMGLIPSLQCCLCLCLYHPECVGHHEGSTNEEYICKNCCQDTEEIKKPSALLTPPPLIPISMITTQNSKPRYSGTIDQVSPPRHEKSLLTENVELTSKNSIKPSKICGSSNTMSDNKTENFTPWFARTDRDYILGQDGSEPKPAQNIAILAGKRYIVVPKNNAGAVQPAITARPDKIPCQAAFIDDKSDKNVSIDDKVLKHQQRQNLESTKNNNENAEPEDSVDLESANNEENNQIEQSVSELHSETRNEIIPTIESSIDTLEKIHEVAMRLNVDKTMTSDDLSIDQDHISVDESGERDNINTFDELQNTEKSLKMNEKSASSWAYIESINTTIGNIKKPPPPVVEVDQRQYFMSTVCAGYNALSRVFQYLKVQELLRAARVCKMWRDLAAHPILWKTVRMKNSQVTDWDGLVASLQRNGTQHLDLRKMLIAGESDSTWKKFVSVIPNVTTLTKLELCRCPVIVVEEVIKACPRLEVLSAMSIKCEWLNLEAIGNLSRCQDLRLKAISGMSLNGDLSPLQNLIQLSHLSLTSVKELGKKKIEVLGSLINLETLELGECSDFPSKFGTAVLCKLTKLERLRLEKGQGTCCTFDILNGVSKLDKLQQLELVNFDVKNGFDKRLANCKNIKRLLIIPTYISQSATSNNMVLGGVTELSSSLTHFVWGVTLELLRVTELFVDQCNQMNKQVSGDSIPVLKPVPCIKLIETTDENEIKKGDEKSLNLPTPQVDILPLPQLQKLLLTALPKTRVKILKIPFHATWRQSISDTASQ